MNEQITFRPPYPLLLGTQYLFKLAFFKPQSSSWSVRISDWASTMVSGSHFPNWYELHEGRWEIHRILIEMYRQVHQTQVLTVRHWGANWFQTEQHSWPWKTNLGQRVSHQELLPSFVRLRMFEVMPQFMSYQGHCQTELGMGISYSDMEKKSWA